MNTHSQQPNSSTPSLPVPMRCCVHSNSVPSSFSLAGLAIQHSPQSAFVQYRKLSMEASTDLLTRQALSYPVTSDPIREMVSIEQKSHFERDLEESGSSPEKEHGDINPLKRKREKVGRYKRRKLVHLLLEESHFVLVDELLSMNTSSIGSENCPFLPEMNTVYLCKDWHSLHLEDSHAFKKRFNFSQESYTLTQLARNGRLWEVRQSRSSGTRICGDCKKVYPRGTRRTVCGSNIEKETSGTKRKICTGSNFQSNVM